MNALKGTMTERLATEASGASPTLRHTMAQGKTVETFPFQIDRDGVTRATRLAMAGTTSAPTLDKHPAPRAGRGHRGRGRKHTMKGGGHRIGRRARLQRHPTMRDTMSTRHERQRWSRTGEHGHYRRLHRKRRQRQHHVTIGWASRGKPASGEAVRPRRVVPPTNLLRTSRGEKRLSRRRQRGSRHLGGLGSRS